MKSNTQLLFNLILGLSKKDRLIFSKKLVYENLNNCSDLFKEILKLIDINNTVEELEGKLKINLTAKLKKYYRITKSNLKKELINFLNENNSSCDINCMLRNSINEGVTLIKLNYFNEGLKLINETKQKAIDEECFEEVVYALEKLRQFDFSYRNNFKLASKLNEEILHYHHLINNINELMSLSFYIFSFQGDLSVKKEQVFAIMDYDIISNENKALSLKAKKFYFLCWLDIYNTLKDYERMYAKLEDAIVYAKNAFEENVKYCLTLLLMYERLEFVSYNLKKYDKALETIAIIEEFKIPPEYKNNNFIYRLKNLNIRRKKTTIYGATNDKRHYASIKDNILFMKETKMSVSELQMFYYVSFFDLTVKLQKHKDVCLLFKDYLKFFIKNKEELNSSSNQLIQIFLCYYLCAFKLYSQASFIYINKELLKTKYNNLFKNEDAPYLYVNKLFNVFLKSYENGFFQLDILEEYFGIWKEFPHFLPKANCIPKNALAQEYNEDVFGKIMEQYEDVVFEC